MFKVVTTPKHLTLNFLSTVINDFNFVFDLEKKLKKDFHLNLSNIEKVDLAGLLVLFKFIEYSASKQCFEQPILYGGDSGEIAKAISEYGFDNLFKEYVKNRVVESELKKLKIITEKSFMIAPHALMRGKHKTKKEFDYKIESTLSSFYGNNSLSLISTILNCAAEISSNFYNHAVQDSKTIILAKGTKTYFEIACADTAYGIPTTLKKLEIYNKKENLELLELSLQQEVTSKPNSSHMGYGLWMIREVVRNYKGTLEIYTENVKFSLKNNKEKFTKSPFWKGTIIYMKIPIINGIDIAGILKENRKKSGIEISINFS